MKQRFIALFWMCFNSWRVDVSKIRYWQLKKRSFSSLLFLYFCQLLFSLLSLVWHLWQQKNNIAVGRRARLRVYARKRSSPIWLPNDGLRKCDCFAMSVFHISCIERKKCTFLRFFPSLGGYLPIYLLGGAKQISSAVLISFHFHGESHKPYFQLCLFWR